ncbi:DUF4087 domain-containing protein [Photobacterium nomapromontoriensis]|uniref:DUF4087 domain-containing protein n=1 Tax=Photobacterium nomapromontoriensis TaxID=2910237 RepID=UPI003D0A171D
MKNLTIILLLFIACFSINSNAAQLRCGWVLNPTPSNLWLHDRDGTWTIALMGENLEEKPSLYMAYQAFEDRKQVENTNGIYGHSCACIKVDVNKESKRILKIYAVNQLNLKQCQDDNAISNYVLD